MSTPPRPLRRHSAAVYRRRRLVVLVLAVIVVAGVWLLIAQPWRSAAGASASAGTSGQPAEPLLPAVSAAPQATPTPGATPGTTAGATPGATPQATAVTAPACARGDLDVEGTTDSTSYAAGQEPQLRITVTNNGADCTLDVGSAVQVFTVSSGDDVWWRSTDCQVDPSHQLVTLTAGQKVTSSQPVTWDRTRSSVATCQAPNRPQAPAHGATYHLSVSIGGIPSAKDATFQLY